MGLLDALNPEARAGLMMMAAAGPTAQPMNFGQRMAGLLAAMDAQKAAEEDRKMRQQGIALQQRHLQAQIDETQAQAQQRAAAAQAAERQAQEQQRIRGLVASAFAPVAPVQANAASGVTGPRPQALDVVGTRPQVDYQGLIAQGVPPELVQKLAESRNYGRDEVARTVEVMGPNGPETVQVDKFGNRVGQGFAKPFELKMQDLGGQVVALNPFTGARQGGGLAKTNTPDALLSAETARRGQNMADDRARESNQTQRDAVGKVEWKQDVNGNWIALPKEVSGNAPVVPITTTAPGKREQQAQNALGIIDQAEKLIDKATGSYIGAGVDLVGRAFGGSTDGAVAGSQLKALEGALMMAQPRMEGPQSDKDVALYRQMAAQIGNPTVPAAEKKAALKVVRELHSRYAGQGGAATPAPAGFRVLGKE